MESNVAQLPLQDRLWTWFESNRKQVLWGALVVVGGGLVVWFLMWRHDENELAASNALSTVAAGMLGAAGRADAAEGYLAVAAKYPGSQAGARAQLLAAGSLFAEGKFPEARAQFEKFTHDYNGSQLMGEALLGIAASFDAEGKTDQAVTAYRDLIERHPGEAVIPQAKFALGRLYEAQNKPEQARTQFEEVARLEPYGSFGDEARMRIEDLNARFPKLPPSTPIPTNAPFTIEKK